MKGINKGKQNGNYIDGISIRLKKKIEKEPYCKICDCSESLIVHHLDKNKENNKWNNLIVLCNQCHNVLHQRGYNFTKNEWKIKVTECFTSIQSEGINSGFPSHFIRLFGCNLDCKFCDSDYSKNGKFKELDYLDIINLCKQWKKKYKINRIIITGGEPFLQNIKPLLLISKLFNFKIEIETNGTLPLCNGQGKSLNERVYKKELVDIFNISPKLKGSQKEGLNQHLINKNNIEQFKQFNHIFKFVIKDEKDLKKIFEIKKRCNILNEKIMLMPLSIFDNRDLNKKIQQDVWNICVRENLKFCFRSHINIWGNKRCK